MNPLFNFFDTIGRSVQGAGQSVGGFASNLMNMFGLGGGSGGGGLSNILGGGGGGGNKPPQFSPMNQSSQYSPGNSTGGFANSIPNAIAGKDSIQNKQKSWLESLFPGGTAPGIAGIGIPALGDLLSPKVKQIPDFGSLSSVQALQNFRPGNSVSPEYQDMLQRNTAILREQKKRELDAIYHNARPGTDYTTDTNYLRDLGLMDKSVQDNLTSGLASAEATFSGQEQQRLSELAQMDIFQIMAQTGLSAQEANNFKKMFSDVGNVFLTKATKSPGYDEDIMAQFMKKMLGTQGQVV